MRDEELFEQFGRAMHRFKKVQFASVFEDLSMREFMTLHLIEKFEQDRNESEVPLSFIIERQNVKPQAASRTFRNMEDKGWIIRKTDAKNHRNVMVSITESGRMIVAREHENMHQFMRDAMAKINQDDLVKMIQVWNDLADALEETMQERKDKKK